MNRKLSVKDVVMAAAFAALTLLATVVLKIPTPALGYVHIGDTFVILAGIILGPALGSLAAGIGSALADLLGGFAVWAPGTFVIKLLSALVCALIYRAIDKSENRKIPMIPAILLSGIAGEIVMVIGYFLYHILIVTLAVGGMTHASLASALSLSAAEIPFNLVQGAIGLGLATALAPIFLKIFRYSE